MIISHDLEDILKLTRNLLIVDAGQIACSGHYLDIADSGLAEKLISHKEYINTIELQHKSYSRSESINLFALIENPDSEVLRTNSVVFEETHYHGKKVRLCIYPDDVVLSRHFIENTSLQNQLKAQVVKIRDKGHSVFVTIDCGFQMVSEITKAAFNEMQLKTGEEVYGSVKAKAIEMVHVYNE